MDLDTYIIKQHKVASNGRIEIPTADGVVRLKRYSLIAIEEKDFTEEERGVLDEVVTNKVFSGEIKPRLGLGFTIASRGVLSVLVWGGVSFNSKSKFLHFQSRNPRAQIFCVSPTFRSRFSLLFRNRNCRN